MIFQYYFSNRRPKHQAMPHILTPYMPANGQLAISSTPWLSFSRILRCTVPRVLETRQKQQGWYWPELFHMFVF